MCLRVVSERITGDKPPRRRHAWKVVEADRSATWQIRYTRKYRKGSVHKAPLAQVLEGRKVFATPLYNYGLHVYQTRAAARKNHYADLKIIKVQVDPADWVADGEHEAVYTKLKVLT